jgi:hypothetical protein
MAFGLLVAAGWLFTGSCQTYLLLYLTSFERWDIVVLASLATCEMSVGLVRRQYKAPQIRSLHGFFIFMGGFYQASTTRQLPVELTSDTTSHSASRSLSDRVCRTNAHSDFNLAPPRSAASLSLFCLE